MNINKNAKKEGKIIKNKKTADFIPILPLLHVLIKSMVQFDKYIHPVIFYEYYLICIFMNIHNNLKNEEIT